MHACTTPCTEHVVDGLSVLEEPAKAYHHVLWLWACGVCVYSSISIACVDAKRVVAYSTAWHVGMMLMLLVLLQDMDCML